MMLMPYVTNRQKKTDEFNSVDNSSSKYKFKGKSTVGNSLYSKDFPISLPSTSWALTDQTNSVAYEKDSSNAVVIKNGDSCEFGCLDMYDNEVEHEISFKESQTYRDKKLDVKNKLDGSNKSSHSGELGQVIISESATNEIVEREFLTKRKSIADDVSSKQPCLVFKESDYPKEISVYGEKCNVQNCELLSSLKKNSSVESENISPPVATGISNEIKMPIHSEKNSLFEDSSNASKPYTDIKLKINDMFSMSHDLENKPLEQSNTKFSTESLNLPFGEMESIISRSSLDDTFSSETPEEISFTEDMLQANLVVQQELEAASVVLQAEQAKQQRQANTIEEHMYQECKELLSLFGVPYVDSAAEAEAQCAFYDSEDITHGTITDDSDVWLFGGKRVYKNFFAQQKYVEFYKDKEILSHFGLDRLKLISFAMLTGSDYTEGIEGVGRVTAMEVISEFTGEGIDALKKFKSWWENVKKHSSPPKNKVRAKLQKLSLSDCFPNITVFDAYLNPEVDNSKESFTWGRPDLDALREYAREKFGWKKEKLDNALLPVLKRLNERTAQTHLDSFFTINLKKETNLFPSKRIMSALRKITSPEKLEETSVSKNNSKGKRRTKNCKSKTVPKKFLKQNSKITKLQATKFAVKQSLQLSEDSSTED